MLIESGKERGRWIFPMVALWVLTDSQDSVIDTSSPRAGTDSPFIKKKEDFVGK